MYAQRTDSATTALLTSAAAEPPRSVNSCFVEKQAEHHNEVAVVKLYGALSCLKNNSNRVRAKTQKRGQIHTYIRMYICKCNKIKSNHDMRKYS